MSALNILLSSLIMPCLVTAGHPRPHPSASSLARAARQHCQQLDAARSRRQRSRCATAVANSVFETLLTSRLPAVDESEQLLHALIGNGNEHAALFLIKVRLALAAMPYAPCVNAALLVLMVVLCQHGADANATTRSLAQTPLHYAARSNSVPVAKALLACMQDVNPADSNGDTPVHCAIRDTHAEMVELLLSNPKVDINRRNNEVGIRAHNAASVMLTIMLSSPRYCCNGVVLQTPLDRRSARV